MDSEQILKYVGVIVFFIGIICVGGVVYHLIWGDWMTLGWVDLYTWLSIIGIPCLIIGTILVNKYLR